MFTSVLNAARDVGHDVSKADPQTSSGIWSTMLKSVGSVNNTPSGTLLLLGGSTESQKLLIQRIQQVSLTSSNTHKIAQPSSPPTFPSIANSFALGYTYIEFKDQDHDDKLSHLDIYTLPSPANETFLLLLHDFLTRKVSNGSSKPLLISILLDWNDPLKSLAKELASWIKIIKKSLQGVDQPLLDSNSEKIRHKLQTYVAPTNDTDAKAQYSSVELPLESGQYDLPLGIDLSIVVQGSERIIYQDSKNLISDDTIDFIQQFLRTVALKHGSSVLYTPKSLEIPNSSYVSLISEHLSLPVSQNQNQRGVDRAHPSVVNIDKIVIPAGWDSRGKILTLKEGFDIDLVLKQWENDIKVESPTEKLDSNSSTKSNTPEISTEVGNDSIVYEDTATGEDGVINSPYHQKSQRRKELSVEKNDQSDEYDISGAVEYYELEISHLHPEEELDDEKPEELNDRSTKTGSYRKNREQKTEFQDFMSQQYEVLESKIQREDGNSQQNQLTGTPAFRRQRGVNSLAAGTSTPSQQAITQAQQQVLMSRYNIGGIQVESSDEVFRRLKVQEAANSAQEVTASPTFSDSSAPSPSPYAGENGNEVGGPGNETGSGLGLNMDSISGKYGLGSNSNLPGYMNSPTALRHQSGRGGRNLLSQQPQPYSPLGKPKGMPVGAANATVATSSINVTGNGSRKVSLGGSPTVSTSGSFSSHVGKVSNDPPTNPSQGSGSTLPESLKMESMGTPATTNLENERLQQFFQSVLDQN